ncbi:MAG: TlpA disulfide reductase family protein [Gammaproteobacteria bacterium]|nr:TlpA disulfide reductase family protein [Gammaproteobacteria bacterium]
MKHLACLFGLLLLPFLLASCSLNPPKSYTIFVELVVIENEVPKPADDGSAAVDATQNRIDPSALTVAVTYKTIGEEGQTENVEMHTGSFAAGELEFSGEIDEPTTIDISVADGEEVAYTATTVLSPGDPTRFALVDYPETRPADQLILLGSSRSSTDPTKRVSIAGDFSAIDESVTHGVAYVQGKLYGHEGERQFFDLGEVLLEDSKFLIEADIDEPTVVFIRVSDATTAYNASTRDAIAEPGGEIVVSPRGTGRQLLASSKSGLNASVVASWQQTEEYLSILDENNAAFKRWADALDAQANQPKDSESETQEASVDSSTDETETSESSVEDVGLEAETTVSEESGNDQETEEQATVAVASEEPANPPAEGCEYAALESDSASGNSMADMSSQPEFYITYYETRAKLDNIRIEALQDIAINAEEPFESLLAMEMGAFSWPSVENRADGLPVYDRISSLLDEDIVARRVTHERKRLANYVEVERNDKVLQPGQRAPEFTLPDLSGLEVALYDVLAEKELVLIDFWASWCGPCIADFPELKKLYAAYHGFGFEIVGVSIDSALEDWKGGSTENKLPWIDLGEMRGVEGATATTYGVSSIPKGYLLDSKGCILNKNLRPAALEEILVARFGAVSESKDTGNATELDASESSENGIGS